MNAPAKVSDRRAVADVESIPAASPIGIDDPAALFLAAIRAGASTAEAREVGDMLLQYQEAYASRVALREYNGAFASAMCEMPVIEKTARAERGKAGSFDYAPLDEMLSKAQPVLAKHGLHLSFEEETSADGKTVTACSVVRHKGGFEKRSPKISSPVVSFSSANTALQNQAGTMTALKRVLTENTLGLAVGAREEAAAYLDMPPMITAEQFTELNEMISATETNLASFLQFLNVDRLEDLSEAGFQTAMRALEIKRRRANADA